MTRARSTYADLPRGAAAVFLVATVLAVLWPAVACAVPGSGTAAIDPSGAVSAGSLGTWTITYTATEAFSHGTVELTIPPGWSLPQTTDGFLEGYVTVSSSGTLGLPPASVTGRQISVAVDTLDIGGTVTIVYGSIAVSVDGRAEAQTSVEDDVVFATASDPAGTSGAPIASSPIVDVVAASVDRLVFLTPPRSIEAGGESDVVRIGTQDAYGNPSPVLSDQTIDLSSTSPTGAFSALPGAGWSGISSVTMLAGEDTVSFFCRDTAVGTHDISVAASGQSWTGAVQELVVDAAAPFRLVVSPTDTMVTAGEFARFSISVEDVYGNPSSVTSDQTISLLAAAGSFYDPGNHATPIAQAIVPTGTASASVDYRHTAMNATLGYFLAFIDNDGSAPSLESATTTVYVDNAEADTLVSGVEVAGGPVTADGIDEAAVSVTVRDAFDNPVDGVAVTIEATDTGGGNAYTQPAGVTGADGVA
ncbi:MAG: Ig-like domain-containing protein, partial [Candidatus Krumholzibacteriota bacterium]|nr:Ig-like domain-containing protein [Candidatus Krumholzibacteriota bacterium]